MKNDANDELVTIITLKKTLVKRPQGVLPKQQNGFFVTK